MLSAVLDRIPAAQRDAFLRRKSELVEACRERISQVDADSSPESPTRAG